MINVHVLQNKLLQSLLPILLAIRPCLWVLHTTYIYFIFFLLVLFDNGFSLTLVFFFNGAIGVNPEAIIHWYFVFCQSLIWDRIKHIHNLNIFSLLQSYLCDLLNLSLLSLSTLNIVLFWTILKKKIHMSNTYHLRTKIMKEE